VLAEGLRSIAFVGSQCVEELKSLLPPLPKPSPPLLQQSDDKLTAVRKTVNVAIFDLENILGAANNALLRAQVRHTVSLLWGI